MCEIGRIETLVAVHVEDHVPEARRLHESQVLAVRTKAVVENDRDRSGGSGADRVIGPQVKRLEHSVGTSQRGSLST